MPAGCEAHGDKPNPDGSLSCPCKDWSPFDRPAQAVEQTKEQRGGDSMQQRHWQLPHETIVASCLDAYGSTAFMGVLRVSYQRQGRAQRAVQPGLMP